MSSGRRSASASRASRSRSVCSEDGLNLEDVLVAKYLDEIQKPATQIKNTSSTDFQSPYQQKLANSHVVPIQGVSRRRPVSAASGRRGTSRERPRGGNNSYDDSFISDDRPPRPTSAPVYKRPHSAYSTVRPGSAKSGTKKVRPLYRIQSHALVVNAFKNGSRTECARVAAPNFHMLLEACTDKLQLPKAARRMFSADGRELFTNKDIKREMEVFVSTGESFRNPLKEMRQTANISLKTNWTVNGLTWPKEMKKPAKFRMSRRFRELIQPSHRRVLVFQNGSGTNSVETVADPKKLDEFLTACTAKLELGSCGRILYDWEGNEVNDLNEAPVLDDCLQNGSTPVLGPLWLSKGEGFSPKGVKEFLSGLIAYTKSKLKEAKRYQKQLQYSQDDDTKDKVEIVAILSMTDKEVDDALKMVAHDIDVFSNACNRLQEQLDKIREAADEEMEKGVSYKLKHIKTLESDDKMIGRKGIRLKVYENGSNEQSTVLFFNMQQALRGMENIDNKLREQFLMQRLLDQCANSSSLAYPKKTPAIRPMPKKLYNNKGQEIKSVHALEYDQKIWLSFGEPWINPCTYVVSMQLDKVRAFEIEETSAESSSSNRTRALREQVMNEDMKDFESLREPTWEAVTGLPDDFHRSKVHGAMEKDTVLSQLSSSEIDTMHSCFLRNKESPKMLLFCEAVVADRMGKSKQDKKDTDAANERPRTTDGKRKRIESTINDLQLWTISKSGYISNKSAPHLVLGVFNNQKVATRLGHPIHGQADTKIEGFYVGMQKKDHSSSGQQWQFTPEGNICSQESPDLLLTYVGSVNGDEESHVANEEPGLASGQKLFLCVCPRLDGKQATAQRWAIKQERFDNIGQWKHTRVDNPEWNKRALSWPVKQNGELNEKYDWPMEGFLLPYAPPTKPSGSVLGTTDSENDVTGADHSAGGTNNLRMKVLKNGICDPTEAVVVVSPPLKKSHSGRDTAGGQKTHTRHHHRRRYHDNQRTDEPMIEDAKIHCSDMTILKQQFLGFLDQCTVLLDLPFAARRLFDENGVEHFNLTGLRRDQLVYVTCGEPWSDPKLSKSEQQRHFLLSNLATDVAQIRNYIQLSKSHNLVLEIDPAVGLRSGAQLIVDESTMNDQNETGDDDNNADNNVFNSMTAHEMSHRRSEELGGRIRWPWEKLVNSGMDSTEDPGNEASQEIAESRSKRRPVEGVTSNRVALQQFVYEDGFIACESNRELVLSVHEQDAGHVLTVCLTRRRPDDVCQRWIISNFGQIQAKCNPQMVLTVSMKRNSQSSDGSMQTFVGCPVMLQRAKNVQLGRANQKWHFETETGLIRAFYTDTVDKEITAANVANVCTFAVMGETEVDQVCYEVELPAEKGEEAKKIWTCSSCARAMRGRYRMTKLENSVDFICAMGKAKELGIQQVGSFRCLNGKVDLSTHEAEHTLSMWESRLQKLRQEMGARTIAKNISAAKAPYTVKVLAYRNGDGRAKPPEMIIGSSVPGILSQCSKRLKMTQAARRLYTADGTMVLNVDDLIDWAKESYVKAEKQRLQREANGEKSTDNKPDGTEQEQERGDAEDNTVALPQGTEFVVGSDSSCDRAFLDTSQNCIIIPDIAPIQADGLLVSWLIFARQPGTVALDVFRRADDELNVFSLVGQTVFTVKDDGLGELLIDISSQPIKVQCGDVIGFHIVENAVIPYDEDESRMSTMIYQSLENIKAHGSTVKLESDLFPARTYSFSANVVVDTKKKDDGSSKTNANRDDVKSVARIRVDPPAVEAVLRYPIEVFVSCGEPFVKPEKVIEDNQSRRQQRSQVAAVSYELYKEKHVLRLMKGRRFEEQTPMRLNATANPEQPVLVDGGWQQPTAGETEKHSLIRHLQMELHKIKSAQKPKTIRMYNSSANRRLFTQPDTKRLLIFPNGEAIESAQYVWGDTVDQILYNSTMRLGLNKQAKYLFTIDGRTVDNLRSVERDQILCVSSNKKFLRPKESQRFVEIKANWVRACKRRGHQASDLDKILFAGSGSGDDAIEDISPRKSGGHTHSIELKANKFTPCPTCKHKCVAEMEVDDSVQLSARQ